MALLCFALLQLLYALGFDFERVCACVRACVSTCVRVRMCAHMRIGVHVRSLVCMLEHDDSISKLVTIIILTRIAIPEGIAV